MTDSPTPYRDRINQKLSAALAPVQLEIKDDSHKHAKHGDRMAALGHSGKAPTDTAGETHFRVSIVSEKFGGLNRVARQRLVYDLLKDELAERVHSLALETRTPEEVA